MPPTAPQHQDHPAGPTTTETVGSSPTDDPTTHRPSTVALLRQHARTSHTGHLTRPKRVRDEDSAAPINSKLAPAGGRSTIQY